MQQFLGFVQKEDMKLAQIKDYHIKKYQLELRSMAYSNHTIARKHSALRIFLKFLRKQGLMVENPMEDIKQPMVEKREQTLSPEDVEQIKAAMSSRRDQLLLCLAYYDKIKLADIVGLKKSAYEERQGVLYVGKKAVIPCEETKALLKSVCEKETTVYLAENQHGKPLSESGAYFVLKSHFKQAGKPHVRPIDLYKR